MNRLDIELEQCWDTLDDAISYFLNLVLDLQAAKRFPEPPTELFIYHEVKDKDREKLESIMDGMVLKLVNQ